jgi:hypothetical protein
VVARSISEKNPSFVEDIPLKVRTRAGRASSKAIELTAPVATVKHGPSRTIWVSYNKVPGAGSNEIQICTGDPNNDASWRLVGTYNQCRVEVAGLEPGTKVYIRVRCHGTGAPGPWSQIVSIIVL